VEGRSAAFAREMMADAKETHGTQERTLDMFGSDDSAIQMAEARTKHSLKIQAGLRRQLAELNSFKGAAKNPGLAKQFGIDATDPAATEAQVEAARAKIKGDLERWLRWRAHPDLKAQVDAAMAAPSAPAPELAARGSSSDSRRLRELQKHQATGALDRWEHDELTRLEQKHGQAFMGFLKETRNPETASALEQEAEMARTTSSDPGEEAPLLFARSSKLDQLRGSFLISTKNIREFAGNVSIKDGSLEPNVWRAFSRQEFSQAGTAAQMVPLDTLISTKNELEDPRYLRGERKIRGRRLTT
jgi:hypothetical protein